MPMWPNFMAKDQVLSSFLTTCSKYLKIIDREVKRLRNNLVPIVKVRWNSRRGPEFTWEREDQFKNNALGYLIFCWQQDLGVLHFSSVVTGPGIVEVEVPSAFVVVQGPFKMGKFRKTLVEGALHLGPKQDRVFADLTPEEKERFKADTRATNILLQGGQTNTFDDAVDEAPVQDLELNKDNVFQADQCNAFDSDVDESPTTQTMFIANLSSANPIYDEAGPSYDSDFLSEIQDPDNYYVKDNAVQVVQSNVSSLLNDALMMIINDVHEQSLQCVSANEQTKVVNESLTAELARL
nr:putative reverse transcriptase domain-containing protein [Tanacetum cinerariifolium]